MFILLMSILMMHADHAELQAKGLPVGDDSESLCVMLDEVQDWKNDTEREAMQAITYKLPNTDYCF